MPGSADRSTDADITPAQLLEAVVFAPIGIGAAVISEAPKRLKQLRSDLVAARFLGEMAVTQGAAQVRARMAEPSRTPERPVEEATEPPDEPVPSEVAEDGQPEVSAETLAIPDYDTVPAIDVVTQLGDLDDAERSAIEAYERAHRGRRTILGKLAQLAETA